MSTAKKKLFRTDEITEKTVVEATKRLNDVVIKLADHGLDRALEVKTELKELRQSVNDLRSTTEMGFNNLHDDMHGTNQRLDKLEQTISEKLDQQTEFLKQLVINTKKSK